MCGGVFFSQIHRSKNIPMMTYLWSDIVATSNIPLVHRIFLAVSKRVVVSRLANDRNGSSGE